MVLLTFVGINAELWAGHKSYRYENTQLQAATQVCSVLGTGNKYIAEHYCRTPHQ